MSKILMITIELPYPPTSGGRMKSWNMLKFLSEKHEMGLACPIKYGDDKVEKMRSQLKLLDFCHAKCEIPRTSANLIKSYVQGVPLNVFRSGSHKLKEDVTAIAQKYDAILLDHYEGFQYIPQDFKGKIFFHAHNATYLMWERYAVSGSNLAVRLVAKMEAERVKKYEKNVCRKADLIFAAPNDIDMLAVTGVEKKKFRETYHLGDDSQLAFPSIEFKKTEKKILYVGTLNWEANIDGLLWFIQEIWPKVLQRDSEIKLDIVGGNPDERIVQACQLQNNIRLLGFVDDLEQCFVDSRVFIAPLRFGSGIKVKVLNSMCRGLPIVTTSVGAEGIAVKNMVHMVIADTVEGYFDGIIQLMNDMALWNKIEENSRKIVIEKYTWKKVLGAMNEEIIENMN